VDVFIDYAGGAQLEAAIDLINVHGRIIKVGDTSSYDGTPAPGPANMFQLILKRVDMLGRSIFDYLSPPARLERAYALLREWVADGRIKVHETVYEGIDQAPQAQIDLFKGKNIGKMLVKLGDPLPR
jgi:NADPH-dependent curcumin reductase CurA